MRHSDPDIGLIEGRQTPSESHSTFPVDVLMLVFLAGSFLVTTRLLSWNMTAIATGLVLLYVTVGVLGRSRGAESEQSRVYWTKLGLVLTLIAVTVVLPTWRQISLRHEEGLHLHAHDGVIQVEEAIKVFLDGRNPYAVTYEDTPLGRWPNWTRAMPNPALYNLAYLPAMFLLGLPFRALAEATVGWYDQRFLYLLSFAVALWVFRALSRDRDSGLIALVVIGLNPLSMPFYIEGRNDIVVVALLGLSLWTLTRTEWRWRYAASGVIFGLACSAKQFAWVLLPFLLLYLLRRCPPGERRWREVGVRWLAPLVLTGSALVLPFFLWDPNSFIEDTLRYVSGRAQHPYPIKPDGAYGFHVLLSNPGFWSVLDSITSGPLGFLRPLADALKIRSETQYYPFWIFQALFALPVFVLAIRRQLRENAVAVALSGYALTLFTYLYFSRFMSDNYIGFLATVLALAYVIREPLADGSVNHGDHRDPGFIVERAEYVPGP